MKLFPHYFQHDAMDCGPACLKIVAAYYGKSYSLKALRDKCHVTREGVSLLGISDAAESIGFRTSGVKITWEQLRAEACLPCILHWNQDHFVVVYDIQEKSNKCQVLVSDPATGLLKYDKEAFLRSWLHGSADVNAPGKGIALLLAPTPRFYQEISDDGGKIGFSYLFRYLRPYRRYIAQLLIAMLVASLLSLILPFITQSIVDEGIGTGRLSFIVTMLIAQLVIVVGQLANDLIRGWLMLHMTARVSISLISDFLAKLMRLPISFFDSKMTGDIMQRIDDHQRIQAFLTNSLLSIVMAGVLLVVYGGILGGYNLKILGVFAAGSAIYVLWVLLFLRRRRKLDYMRFQEASANQSNIVQLIGGMQDIKLNGCEKQKRWEWERIQARLFKVSIKSLTLNQTQQAGGVFIDQIKNVLISYLAARAVISGDMTLGMMMSLQYIIGQLNAPVSQFITFVQETQDAAISMERLGEIHGRQDEEPENEQKIMDIPAGSDIVLKDLTFQYDGPHSPKVLDEINLTIPSNKVTAVVGASGSGKTTLLKIILGFYQPTGGDVLLGEIPLKRFSESSWRGSCGTVMQEGYIFTDTIAANIGVSDDDPDMNRVREAAEVSNICNWIEKLPLGYYTKVGMDGHGLSTGQKQRILIARAAYKNSKFLFFDEATNSLDANNEKVIMKHLNELFKDRTVVIVAHRLSTVKNADNIVVLDKGRIAEQGTHEYLIKLKGKYYMLVKNQLELGD